MLVIEVLSFGWGITLMGFCAASRGSPSFRQAPRNPVCCLLPLALGSLMVLQNIWLPEKANVAFALLRLLIILGAFWFVDFLSSMMAITAYLFASMLSGSLQVTSLWADRMEWVVGAAVLFALLQVGTPGAAADSPTMNFGRSMRVISKNA